MADNPPNWTRLAADTAQKISILQAAWTHTAAECPALHEGIKRDLYIPALQALARFCASVDREELRPESYQEQIANPKRKRYAGS
jgi:hypothetical protein